MFCFGNKEEEGEEEGDTHGECGDGVEEGDFVGSYKACFFVYVVNYFEGGRGV